MSKRIDFVRRAIYGNKQIILHLVNGEDIRKQFGPDFAGGGHHYVYSFIPKDEIWIERNYAPNVRALFFAHELFEYILMSSKNYSYDRAHEIANNFEQRLRNNEPYENVLEDFVRKYNIKENIKLASMKDKKVSGVSSEAWWTTNFEKVSSKPLTFYHGTTEEAWEEIQKEGALWGKRNAPSRCTYLSYKKEDAGIYDIHGLTDKPCVMLEINIPTEKVASATEPNAYWCFGDWQVRVYEPIPLEYVRRIDKTIPAIKQAAVDLADSYIKQYDTLHDIAHGTMHIQAVRDHAKDLAKRLKYKNEKLLDYAALLHDIGNLKDREQHHIEGEKMVLSDKKLRKHFSEKEIKALAHAVRSHRSSDKRVKAKSTLAKIVADADKLDSDLGRAYTFNRLHQKMTDEEAIADAIRHQQEKFGPKGYGYSAIHYPITKKLIREKYGPILDAYAKGDMDKVRAAINESKYYKAYNEKKASNDHILLTGYSGSGKTTLAKKLKKETGSDIVNLDNISYLLDNDLTDKSYAKAKEREYDKLIDELSSTKDSKIVEGVQLLKKHRGKLLLDHIKGRKFLVDTPEKEARKRAAKRNVEWLRAYKYPVLGYIVRKLEEAERKQYNKKHTEAIDKLKKKIQVIDANVDVNTLLKKSSTGQSTSYRSDNSTKK